MKFLSINTLFYVAVKAVEDAEVNWKTISAGEPRFMKHNSFGNPQQWDTWLIVAKQNTFQKMGNSKMHPLIPAV